jgi:hypothetical protein
VNSGLGFAERIFLPGEAEPLRLGYDSSGRARVYGLILEYTGRWGPCLNLQ